MFKKSKKYTWICFLSLLSLTAASLFISCRKQVALVPMEAPAEIATGQIVKHTPHQAAIARFQAAVARFDAKLAQDVAEDGIGSISAGVVVENDLVYANGFGWADVEQNIPADEETIYRVGSISKSFTAVLMMQMIEKGFFKLDDPVEKKFPEIKNLQDKPENTAPITFRHLASHTAGLIKEPRLPGAASGPISHWEDKLLASIPKTFFQSPPGEKYSYSNIGFGILGLAVSRAVREPFIRLVKRHIILPLGMTNTFFILTKELIPYLAMGYVKRKDGSVDPDPPAGEHAGRGYNVPNGSIYSNVGDLARFVAAMTGASPVRIFSEKTRKEILKQQTPEGGTCYGLGFFIRVDKDGFTTMGHGGSVAGYNAHMVFDPETKIGVIILRNYNRGKTNLGRTAQALLKELVQK